MLMCPKESNYNIWFPVLMFFNILLSGCGYTKYIETNYDKIEYSKNDLLVSIEVVGSYEKVKGKNIVLKNSPYVLKVDVVTDNKNYLFIEIIEPYLQSTKSKTTVDISSLALKKKGFIYSEIGVFHARFAVSKLILEQDDYLIQMLVRICDKNSCEYLKLDELMKLNIIEVKRNKFAERISGV